MKQDNEVMREEKNRKLAEWLGAVGPMPRYLPQLGDTTCVLDTPVWRWNWASKSWEPRDFYTDESASALLLEKMKPVQVVIYETFTQVYKTVIDNEPQYGPFADGNDRKTAIAEAALKLIARESAVCPSLE
jgi:hypothetical protein